MHSQDQLKTLVALAALEHVVSGEIVGVGTGSTVNKFIEALASIKHRIPGAVSSSNASSARLLALGIKVYDCNEVVRLSVYVDGADEIDHRGYMIKGGGAALTREKIVAALSDRIVCIADESKLVETLGRFALPVEIVPMATQQILRQFTAIGGHARLRLNGACPVVTDNGQHIVDVSGLHIADPVCFESMVNQWPGIVTVGVFAHQKADVLLLGTTNGVRTVEYAINPDRTGPIAAAKT